VQITKHLPGGTVKQNILKTLTIAKDEQLLEPLAAGARELCVGQTVRSI
jgi:hypothetical protein